MSCLTVCAIVPTFNRAHFLGETLDSLLAQTRPLDQIIVVDDGSTDNTKDVVAAYGDKITYLYKENGGRAAALNYAQKHCLCDYIWFCDDDDFVGRRGLEVLLSPIEKDSSLEIVFAKERIFFDRKGVRYILPANPSRKEREPSYRIRTFGGVVTHLCAALIKRDLIEKTGPWNEMFLRSQDYEMLLRLLRSSHYKEIDEVVYYFRQHEAQRGTKDKPFSQSNSRSVWASYDKILAKEVYKNYALEEFTPTFAKDLPQAKKARATYLQRALFMLRCSFFEGAICDFKQVCDFSSEGGLSKKERELLDSNAVLPHILDLLDADATQMDKFVAVSRNSIFSSSLIFYLMSASFNFGMIEPFLKGKPRLAKRRFCVLWKILGPLGMLRRLLLVPSYLFKKAIRKTIRKCKTERIKV